MKKVLIISFLIFTILMSSLITSYAAVNVTEESLENSFKKITESSENEDSSTNYSMDIDKENKKIMLSMDNEEYIMDYDLSDKPTFNIDLSFNNSMTKEEWENEADKATLLMVMFVLIADHEQIDFMDSMTYFMSSVFKNSTPTQPTDISTINNALEYAKLIYDKENTIKDTLFTYTTNKISETGDEYKVQATLIINNDADFSIIKGYSDNTINQMGNTIQNTLENIQELTNSAQQSINNLVNQQESVNKVINSISKLPQTGKFLRITDILYSLCIVSSIALVYIVFKIVKYKNISK